MSTQAHHKEYDWLSTAPNRQKYAQLLEWQKTLLHVFDPRIFGIPHENLLKFIYSYVSKNEAIREVPQVKSLDHTMYEALDEYVVQKLPSKTVRSCIANRIPIEIHGVYPAHIKQLAEYLGFYDLTDIEFDHNPSPKDFNFIRPSYQFAHKASGEKILLVCVPPGRDYTLHYSTMIRHLASLYTRDSDRVLKIYRYPYVENSIHVWTGLDRFFVKHEDIVLLGYVRELEEFIKRDSDFTKLTTSENEYYSSNRYMLKNGKVVNLLGVKYSFWGNNSAKLVYQSCRLGASEILYFGKLGTLGKPEDIYTRVFVPSSYLIMYHDKLICKIDDLHNSFLKFKPELDTRSHVSVPTVLEEDYAQRLITSQLHINSIDNEISQIAFAVRKHNQEQGTNISFSAAHFATDYVRQLEKVELETPFDLSNNRTKEAKEGKAKMIKQISLELLEYLKESR